MTTLKIEGMHCAACVRRVTNALSQVPGAQVESVEVGQAVVAGDVEPEALIAALSHTGFQAQPAS